MTIYRYSCTDCGKTYIGEQLSEPMACNCAPSKSIIGKLYTPTKPPLSGALTEEISSSEAATRRAYFCKRWGIVNKSHKSHGANFSSNQTVVNLINDIVSPVTGALRASVRQHIINDFSYDIDTGEMS